MKCEHLARIPVLGNMGITITVKVATVTMDIHAKDVDFCDAKLIDDCPKKKQPCEINARCWRIGK